MFWLSELIKPGIKRHVKDLSILAIEWNFYFASHSAWKLVKVYLKDNGTRGLTSDFDDTRLSALLFEKFAFPILQTVKEAFAFSFAAYSCHGRWYDAEGTQFVIATQLAPGTGWSNENNRPQPYRNSRRLCFMYKESGGVVSLTASEVACQRGIPPPPPMLAFNATSTGEYPLLTFGYFTLEDP